MRMKNKFLKGKVFLLIGILIILSTEIIAYTIANPMGAQYNNAGGIGAFATSSGGKFDAELCSEGTDFIMQLSPFDCTPAVVRSDLLEEEDVTVFCKIGATQINPLIDVEAVDYISVTGEYPPEIKSVGYFPAEAALNANPQTMESFALNNMGYAMITLKKNSNESSMPEYVVGNLTAKIRYDAKGAFGVGDAEFYLPVLSDEEFSERINQYSFWEGRGFLRAESVDADSAAISIYSDLSSGSGVGIRGTKQKFSEVILNEGETSNQIYIPGFSSCLASFRIKLNNLENPDTRARLKINSDYVEVSEGSKFLDNKCQVKSVRKDGMNQKVSLYCKEDDKTSSFNLFIYPKVKLSINGIEKDYSVGDYLYTEKTNEKSVYLGYIGTKGDSSRTEDLYVVLIASTEHKSKLSESQISEIGTRMNLLFSDMKTGASALDVLGNGLKKFAGGTITAAKWFNGQDMFTLEYKSADGGVISATEKFKDESVSLNGFSEGEDSDLHEITHEIYTLEKTNLGTEEAFLIKNPDGESTDLYLTYNKKGTPKLFLVSAALGVSQTYGSFYGDKCASHLSCTEYILSSVSGSGSEESFGGFFNNLISGKVEIDSKIINLTKISYDGNAEEAYSKYYESAMDDFQAVLNGFADEKEDDSSSETYGEKAFYEAILLAESVGQRKAMKQLCQEFKESYPESDKFVGVCDDAYKISNSEIAAREVVLNGKIKRISFDGIYEPGFNDYGAEIVVRGPNGVTDILELKKGKAVYLDRFRDDEVSKGEYIQLESVDENSAKVRVYVSGESTAGKLFVTNSYTFEIDKTEGIGGYSFTLEDTNLELNAKVSVIPNFNYQQSESTFSFKIGIEKRAIQLSDEQIDDKISSLNDTIKTWSGVSEGLKGFNSALGKACLATGTVYTIKNFLENSDGKSIARQKVMRGKGGWNEICATEVAKEDSKYVSMDDCFIENAPEIDAEVNEVHSVIAEQDATIKSIQANSIDSKFLTNNVVNQSKFMVSYVPLASKSLDDMGSTFEDPTGNGDAINLDSMKNILTYNGWKTGNYYSVEDLREIELYATLVKENPTNEFYNKSLYSLLSDVAINSEAGVAKATLSEKYGVDIDIIEVGGKDANKRIYLGGTYKTLKTEIKNRIPVYPDETPVQIVLTSTGEEYIFILEDKGTKILSVMRDEKTLVKLIYDSTGKLISDEKSLPPEFIKIYFEKIDEKSYKNVYKNPEIRYYEEEPYKGYPAVVPIDVNEGWYAATKPKLGVGKGIAAYDDSGRVNSFWLCNVGENGLEENIGGDDICQQMNVGDSGQPYNQFYGLGESRTTQLVRLAVGTNLGSDGAIQKAREAYRDGASFVVINGERYKVGSPAVSTPAVQCQDFMSPKDCNVLFNVCDPVVCPSSRCDFGGKYPVKDVVQSGVVGSVALCLPNAQEGIVVPVCTTGVQAGIDSWLSVKESYRDCLQENLETGATVGICDEINSVYTCEFFWRQALPLAKIAIPKVLSFVAGENVRGGGEYLGVQSAWQNAGDSLDYFKQYYAANSYRAFKLRSVDEAGGEVCKNFASVVYPSSGELLDSLTSPRSPPQFNGEFDEIPFTTATNPPTSHYKVSFHIYAGEDSGAYYQVYIRGGAGSSYYQDTSVRRNVASGYVPTGDYVSNTEDFTAPSGYSEMCIVVNNQEECGFKQVSTSFAENYINDLYLAEQSTTQVTTEEDCVSGTASLYSFLNPNAENIVDDLIDPALYQKGIIRVCATKNPGVGTDASAETENSRWREVGYCDDSNMKCWLDTDSVKNAIKAMDVEESVLEDSAQSYLDSLVKSGDYVSNDIYKKKIKEINNETNVLKKIELINGIIDKVFFSNQKGQLYLLRGISFADLSKIEFSKLTKVRTISVDGSDNVYLEAIINGEIELPSYWNESASTFAECSKYARSAAEDLFGKYYYYTDAWCREYVDKVVWKADSVDESNNLALVELEKNGKLVPGNIVGVYYPASSWLGKTGTCYGKTITIPYTHNLLYLGKNTDGKMVFAELFYKGLGPTIRTIDEFANHGLIAMVVLSPPDKLNPENNKAVLDESFNDVNPVTQEDIDAANKLGTDALRKLIIQKAQSEVGQHCGDTCYISVRALYDDLKINPQCVFSVKGSEKLSQPECSDCGCKKNAITGNCYDCPRQQYDLREGDLVQVYNRNTASSTGGHNFIFEKWVDKNKKVANIFQSAGGGAPLEHRENYDMSNSPVTVIWEPQGKSSSGSVSSSGISSSEASPSIESILAKLSDNQKEIYNDANNCDDCMGWIANRCDENLCDAIGEKIQAEEADKNCEFDSSKKSCKEIQVLSGASGSGGTPVAEECDSFYPKILSPCSTYENVNLPAFTESERKIFTEVESCDECGGKSFDTNFCDKEECKAISLKTGKVCSFDGRGLLSGSCTGGLSDEGDGDLLIKSAEGGDLNTIKSLIKEGENINSKDPTGWTALMFASARNHFDIVKYLVENGADVNIKNNLGDTALDFAISEDISNYLESEGAKFGDEISPNSG